MKIGKLLLYHGSNMVVDCPKWNHGSRYRDFGQCFYTTHSREMARDWAEKMSLVNPVVNGYALDFRQRIRICLGSMVSRSHGKHR